MCDKCRSIEQLGDEVNARFNERKAKTEQALNTAVEAAEAEFNNATAQATADLKLAQSIFQKDTEPARKALEDAVDAAERAADAERVEAWKDLNAAAAARGMDRIFTDEELEPRPTSRERAEQERKMFEELEAQMKGGIVAVGDAPAGLLRALGIG